MACMGERVKRRMGEGTGEAPERPYNRVEAADSLGLEDGDMPDSVPSLDSALDHGSARPTA